MRWKLYSSLSWKGVWYKGLGHWSKSKLDGNFNVHPFLRKLVDIEVSTIVQIKARRAKTSCQPAPNLYQEPRVGDGTYSCGTPQQDIQEELAPAGTKQDSWDRTKILLKSHCEAPNHSVAKLHKIKNILNYVCRSVYIPGLPMLCLYNLCEYICFIFCFY